MALHQHLEPAICRFSVFFCTTLYAYISRCRSTPSPTAASPSPIHVSSVGTKSPIHLSTRRPLVNQKQIKMTMMTPRPNMIGGSTAKMPRHQVRQEEIP